MSHQPDNISAGTQVVSLVEIIGPNHSLVHPRGVLGIVTRTPTGTDSHYLVRFPDGFEKSLRRAEFDVLKHFKDRLPGTTDGRELVFCRYTQPEKDHRMLLALLGWDLPPQSPPKITQKGELLKE